MVCCSKSTKITLAILLVAAMAVGTVAALPQVIARLSYAAETGEALAAREQLAAARQLSTGFQDVAKALRPSVVKINSVQSFQPARSQQIRPELPEEFRRFFGDETLDRFQQFQMPEDGYRREGLGTGVVVSEDGYILTNNHVVRGADEVTVTLSDNRQLQAEVVGNDSMTDLAVLKVDASGLVPAQIGDSDAVEVGEWVVAVGTPFNLQQTVTAGIVSAKGRANLRIADYEDFIQTDAAINPGNSGGPLVNLSGEVIGINTAIASRTGAYSGIGFAIPSNMVRSVMQSIIENGRVDRGWLGAVIQDLTKELARSFGYDSTQGVLIGDVMSGSPAERAGLQSGDIVTTFQGESMASADQLRKAVAATTPGSQAILSVVREGEQLSLEVTVGQLDQDRLAQARGTSGATERDVEQTIDLGMTVRTLTPELAGSLGYSRDATGVVVSRVESGGPAEQAGMQVRDVIVRVGDTRIESLSDFREALSNADLSQGVRLQVRNGDVQRFVFLQSN
ncbi:MAG: DegQ family serine endoprotease [Pirellulales bacterium]